MRRITREIPAALLRLLRHPGHTLALTAVLTVGLAIAIVMFEGLNAYLLRPLPVPHPQQVVLATVAIPAQDIEVSVQARELLAWRAGQHSLTAIAGFYTGTLNLGGIERPERLAGAFVTDGFFETLGVEPALGRGIRPEDCRLGATPALVLGRGTWERSFGHDPAVLGRTVRVNGQAATVVGVMPEGFRLPVDEDAWTSLQIDPASAADLDREVTVVGRLGEKTSPAAVQAELATISKTVAGLDPSIEAGRVPVVQHYMEYFVEPSTRAMVGTMFVCTLLVLLIACANVANLIVARLASRSRELAVRSALGASTFHLVAPVFVECLLVSVAATTAAYGLSRLAMEWIAATLRAADLTRQPFWVHFDSDWRSLVFAGGAALACTFLAGFLPAMRLGRRDPAEGLRIGGRGTVGASLGRMSRALVGVEVALASVVVVSAGLMARTAYNVVRTDFGARTEGVLAGRVGLFPADYPSDADCVRFFARLGERLAGLPGVTGAAVTTSLPGSNSSWLGYLKEGERVEAGRRPPRMHFVAVSPGYFELLETKVLTGRVITGGDTPESTPVVVINAILAERLGGASSVIGTRLQLVAQNETTVRTIVGVVSNIQQGNADQPLSPVAYIPLAQKPVRFASLAVRGTANPSALASSLRAAVREADPNLPIYWLMPLSEWAGQH
ncbi:MAG TPA: ABC transporter permease, partial [Thermoanaerobaculaceae bacterium]|nr:ABC transporter permease [Thermoanaerobaculaceae bacterium]